MSENNTLVFLKKKKKNLSMFDKLATDQEMTDLTGKL